MPRHTFRFSAQVRNAVRQYVNSRVGSIDPRRFNQEPHYCIALIYSLIGTAYDGAEGSVQFETTSIDDRGTNSAENFSGADFAITATISDNRFTVRKAILFQAKLGDVEKMAPSSLRELKDQIRKMRYFTRSPKVMEIVEDGGSRRPRIISGNHVLNDLEYTSIDFGDYVVRRVLTTLDGDTRQGFVDKVQDSSLAELRIKAYSSITP